MSKPFDIVVAADANWGIGKTNGMPWPRLKTDLKNFKELTTKTTGLVTQNKNAIIFGRLTYDSLPTKPLPNRMNIVISKTAVYDQANIYPTRSLDDALQLCQPDDVENIFVIGGGQIYRLALQHPRLRKIYFTKINGVYDCDIFIPNLTELGWKPETPMQPHEENGVQFEIGVLTKC